MPHELLNRNEAAKFLRVSAGTLANWARRQAYSLPMIRIGRKIFYSESDLRHWLELMTINPLSPDKKGVTPKETQEK